MCTSIILFRKNHPWPLIIASNRDEDLNRKSLFPARHWKNTFPKIIGGFDIKAGGSWFAINDYGIIAIIHNRKLENDNDLVKKTRGQIILNLLKYDKIHKSLDKLEKLDQKFYNGFNIILANQSYCFWAKHTSVIKNIEIKEINEGLSILTDKDLNNIKNKKINFYLTKFSLAPIPDPDNNNWLSWELLMATDKIEKQNNANDAICFIDKKNNYGTKSSSIISVSNTFSIKQIKKPIIYRSTEKAPNKSDFVDVDL